MRIYLVCNAKLDDGFECSVWQYFSEQGVAEHLRKFVLQDHVAHFQALFTDKNGNLMVPDPQEIHTTENILWLSREILKDFTGNWLRLKYGGKSHYWKRLTQWPKNNKSIDYQLGRGMLFKYIPGSAPEESTSIFNLCNNINNGKQIGAVNPLALILEPENPIASHYQEFLDPFIVENKLLDVIPIINDEDLPRTKLHQCLFGFLQKISSDIWSRVDRLLATSNWDRGETPFLILDSLNGVFYLPAPESSEPTLWVEPAEREFGWLDSWLIDWCCHKLQIQRKKVGAVPNLQPLPRHPFHSQRREFLRNRPKFNISPENRWVLLSSKINPLLPSGRLIDSSEPEGCIEDFVQAQLKPRSSIYARLPTAPQQLSEHDQIVWQKKLDNCAFDLINTNLFGELLWVSYLTGGTVALPDNPWPAQNRFWGNRFVASLFSRPKPEIQWVAGGTDLLGESLLGKFVLGGTRSEPPAVDLIDFDFLECVYD